MESTKLPEKNSDSSDFSIAEAKSSSSYTVIPFGVNLL